MRQVHRHRYVKILSMLPCLLATAGVTQGTQQITIDIPLKQCPVIPIGEVKAVMSVNPGAGVTSFQLNFENQNWKPGNPIPSATCTLSGSAWSCTPASGFACPSSTNNTQGICVNDEAETAGPDQINVSQTSIGTDDKLSFEIDFLLDSNHGFPAPGNTSSCVNKQILNPNSYQVIINSSPASLITGTCLESFDGSVRTSTGQPNGIQSCNQSEEKSNFIQVPIVTVTGTGTSLCSGVSAPDVVAELMAVNGTVAQPAFACFLKRPSLDTMMVLDKSGSMAITDSGSVDSRITALHNAANDFFKDWLSLPPASGDQVGVIAFDATSSLHITTTPPSPFETVDGTNVNALNANVQTTVVPGSTTSIGAGLDLAQQNMGSGSASRKTILLMTDGQQNTDPMIAVDNGAVTIYCNTPGNCTGSHPGCTSLNHCPLFPSGSIIPAIYVVSLGPSSVLDPAILQDLANSTGGYYVNSESVSEMLEPFFLQMLQNFVHFNTYETVRLLSATVSPALAYSTKIPISTTSHNAVFSLMWPSQFGALRMTLTPPGGGPPIVKQDASGFIELTQALPPPAPYDPTGDWTVTIEAVPELKIAATSAIPAGGIPFDLHLMTDDPAFKTDLAVAPGDYVPGGNIHLRASIRRFGIPVTGLGTHPRDKVVFDLVKPGQSVGDMLSDSTANGTPPPGNPDIQAGADAKLFNTLQATPSALKHDQVPGIQLFDDGKPEHGDDVAGDGIYNALYPAVLPGHYNFLFWVESTDPNGARFSRQQLRTAYVRSVPDAGNTIFAISFPRSTTRERTVSITMTPRVKAGPGCALLDPHCGRMGPGWADYFWFTAPGHVPFKPVDNLDGTYTATMSFTGTAPPPISMHFENVLAVIGDSVPSDQLPDPLGPGNVVVGNVIQQPPATGRFAIFADGGGNVPMGALGANYNNGASLDAGLEYMLATRVSVEGFFGYQYFPGKLNANLNVYQFAANVKVYLTGGRIQPFVNGGPGGYTFSSAGSSSTYAGGNAGAGLLFNISQHLGIQASYNFHAVGTSGAASRFSTYQGGIRYAF